MANCLSLLIIPNRKYYRKYARKSISKHRGATDDCAVCSIGIAFNPDGVPFFGTGEIQWTRLPFQTHVLVTFLSIWLARLQCEVFSVSPDMCWLTLAHPYCTHITRSEVDYKGQYIPFGSDLCVTQFTTTDKESIALFIKINKWPAFNLDIFIFYIFCILYSIIYVYLNAKYFEFLSNATLVQFLHISRVLTSNVNYQYFIWVCSL